MHAGWASFQCCPEIMITIFVRKYNSTKYVHCPKNVCDAICTICQMCVHLKRKILIGWRLTCIFSEAVAVYRKKRVRFIYYSHTSLELVRIKLVGLFPWVEFLPGKSD